jgi:tetratricopeptide (TPR) repeat protein
MFAAAVLICAITAGPLDRGREFLNRGDLAGALYWFESAAVQNPLDPAAWRSAGFAYERLGRYPDAEKALKKSLSLESAPETYSLLSSVYMSMGRWEDAVSAEEAAIRLRLPAGEPEWYVRVADSSVVVAHNISDTASRSSQSFAAGVTAKAKATARGFKRAFGR